MTVGDSGANTEPAATTNEWDAARWLQVGGVAVMALGLVLAWAKVGPFSVTGLVALLAFAVYEIGHVYGTEPTTSGPNVLNIDVDVAPGIGLWLDDVGAAALILGAALSPRRDAS